MAQQAGDTEFIKNFGANQSVELPEAFMLYANAYIILDTEREYLSDIPWSAIVRYGEYYNLTRDQVDWMIEIFRVVDRAVLAKRAKKSGNPKTTS